MNFVDPPGLEPGLDDLLREPNTILAACMCPKILCFRRNLLSRNYTR